MSEPSPSMEYLEALQRDAVGYFLRAANREGAPCSIAATGLGLAAYKEQEHTASHARHAALSGRRGT